MKNLKAPFLVIALLLNVMLLSAETSNHPPAPGATAKSMNTLADDDEDCGLVNCPADIPIDQHIVLLIIGGLALGLTVVYKNQIKKASI